MSEPLSVISIDPATAPAPATREATTARYLRPLCMIVAVAGCLSLLCLNIFRRDSYTGDEGFYGVVALNMLHSPGYLLRPSFFPQGDFMADRNGFAHPPFNSYFYALSLWLSGGSLAGPELVNVLAFALLLWIVYRLVSPYDDEAAVLSVVLLAASPTIAALYSALEAEPLLVTSGMAGVLFVLRAGPKQREKRWYFLGGLCLGLAFALKLWLSGPLFLAAAAAFVVCQGQAQTGWRQKVVALMLIGAGAVIPAGLHLAAIGLFYPRDLGFWLKDIYFGFFTASGIDGTKVAGAGVRDDWVHPAWYYAALLYRNHFFLVPIILAGLGPLLRNKQFRAQWLVILGAGICGLAPLSMMRVKEELYILSCIVFIYLLAGFCLAALARQLQSGEPMDRSSRNIFFAVCSGLLVAFPLAYALRIQPDKITPLFVVIHSIVLLVYLTTFTVARRKAGFRLMLATGAGALIVLSAVFAYHAVRTKPRETVLARLLAPYVKNEPPGALSFIASNFKAYQFHWFRRGCYWTELPLERAPQEVLAQRQFDHVHVFIVDDEDRQRPELKPWMDWLETHASEKTAELDTLVGRVSGFRIFVRETLSGSK